MLSISLLRNVVQKFTKNLSRGNYYVTYAYVYRHFDVITIV